MPPIDIFCPIPPSLAGTQWSSKPFYSFVGGCEIKLDCNITPAWHCCVKIATKPVLQDRKLSVSIVLINHEERRRDKILTPGTSIRIGPFLGIDNSYVKNDQLLFRITNIDID